MLSCVCIISYIARCCNNLITLLVYLLCMYTVLSQQHAKNIIIMLLLIIVLCPPFKKEVVVVLTIIVSIAWVFFVDCRTESSYSVHYSESVLCLGSLLLYSKHVWD